MVRHWAENYVGMTYKPGDFDCADLAVVVQQEVFEHEIMLPSEHPQSMRAITDMIEDQTKDHAKRTDTPKEGDGVLMLVGKRLKHIGIYCEIKGTPYVLHAMRNAGQVTLHKLRDLPKHNLQVEGFYKWK